MAEGVQSSALGVFSYVVVGKASGRTKERAEETENFQPCWGGGGGARHEWRTEEGD